MLHIYNIICMNCKWQRGDGQVGKKTEGWIRQLPWGSLQTSSGMTARSERPTGRSCWSRKGALFGSQASAVQVNFLSFLILFCCCIYSLQTWVAKGYHHCIIFFGLWIRPFKMQMRFCFESFVNQELAHADLLFKSKFFRFVLFKLVNSEKLANFNGFNFYQIKSTVICSDNVVCFELQGLAWGANIVPDLPSVKSCTSVQDQPNYKI